MGFGGTGGSPCQNDRMLSEPKWLSIVFFVFLFAVVNYGVCVYQDAHCRVCNPVAVPYSLTNSRGLKNIACSRCPV